METIDLFGRTWMKNNLNTECFSNGDSIPEAKSNEEWIKALKNKQPAWCYYDNDPSNGEKYGKLYNQFVFNDPRGIAPEGFVIPDFYPVKESMFTGYQLFNTIYGGMRDGKGVFRFKDKIFFSYYIKKKNGVKKLKTFNYSVNSAWLDLVAGYYEGYDGSNYGRSAICVKI